MDNSQIPDKQKTNGENTRIKVLHNLYADGTLHKATDGLITVEWKDSYLSTLFNVPRVNPNNTPWTESSIEKPIIKIVREIFLYPRTNQNHRWGHDKLLNVR